ncbi:MULTISPECIES: IclR family transcriptional regulator [unclassified Corynebacterium]|uniref:IclR family transcriptional regulator n=1 Tax=unclassified Corynebacterium TaxID=2624378 RepID=UPI0029CA24CC|nr:MULTISPECIES: IclR family transcriptional regulator [unclassified Corynebacterium]WPF65644.1 IclR family transcriptional regulator [Corynebacterium sp. 22KM0430]WPF68139.1 IclR family transcriptional regulator [Corynebacterium sp. 21KM1197]
MTHVPAARNTLRILTLLSSIDVPISAARIRAELDLPRSTTYHLLAEMERAGYVVRIPETHTWGLGLVAYSMANAYVTQQPLVRLARRPLQSLAESVGGSAHLSRLAGSEVLYLLEVRGPRAVSLVTQEGVRLEALKTASGRVMLAHLPEAELRAALASNEHATRESQNTLPLIRQRGWEEEVEEVSRGQHSLAVAVLDHVGRPAASLAVTFPVGTLTERDKSHTIQSLKQQANKVASHLYGIVLDSP